MNHRIDTTPDVNDSITENEIKSNILGNFVFHIQKYQPFEEKNFWNVSYALYNLLRP